MGFLKKLKKGLGKTGKILLKEVTNVGKEVGKVGRDIGRNPLLAAATFGIGPSVKRTYKDLTNPEIPTPGPEPKDTALLASIAEERARRRRGAAGRSLLRTSLAPSLGRTGGSKLGKEA